MDEQMVLTYLDKVTKSISQKELNFNMVNSQQESSIACQLGFEGIQRWLIRKRGLGANFWAPQKAQVKIQKMFISPGY